MNKSIESNVKKAFNENNKYLSHDFVSHNKENQNKKHLLFDS